MNAPIHVRSCRPSMRADVTNCTLCTHVAVYVCVCVCVCPHVFTKTNENGAVFLLMFAASKVYKLYTVYIYIYCDGLGSPGTAPPSVSCDWLWLCCSASDGAQVRVLMTPRTKAWHTDMAGPPHLPPFGGLVWSPLDIFAHTYRINDFAPTLCFILII